jgi:hypothetical protein
MQVWQFLHFFVVRRVVSHQYEPFFRFLAGNVRQDAGLCRRGLYPEFIPGSFCRQTKGLPAACRSDFPEGAVSTL